MPSYSIIKHIYPILDKSNEEVNKSCYCFLKMKTKKSFCFFPLALHNQDYIRPLFISSILFFISSSDTLKHSSLSLCSCNHSHDLRAVSLFSVARVSA